MYSLLAEIRISTKYGAPGIFITGPGPAFSKVITLYIFSRITGCIFLIRGSREQQADSMR